MKGEEQPMFVLLKASDTGSLLVRKKEYWDNYLKGREYHSLSVVTEHTDPNALLKMIEIATDIAPDDEKKRKAEADNSPAHVHKTFPLP